jgi:hypothetical protein
MGTNPRRQKMSMIPIVPFVSILLAATVAAKTDFTRRSFDRNRTTRAPPSPGMAPWNPTDSIWQ